MKTFRDLNPGSMMFDERSQQLWLAVSVIRSKGVLEALPQLVNGVTPITRMSRVEYDLVRITWLTVDSLGKSLFRNAGARGEVDIDMCVPVNYSIVA